MQVNLGRGFAATKENLSEASGNGTDLLITQEPYVGAKGTLAASGVVIQYPGGTRDTPVKSAIVVANPNLVAVTDQTLNCPNISSLVLHLGNLTLGIINVYLEGNLDIDPQLRRLERVIRLIGTRHIVLAGDVNAMSPWWGCRAEDGRGSAIADFLAQNDMSILNQGSVSTYHTYRGGKLYSSIVDITACSDSVLAMMSQWKVNTDSAILTDHRTITFQLNLGQEPIPKHPSTRKYNVRKAKWDLFTDTLGDIITEGEFGLRETERCTDPQTLENLIQDYIAAITKASDKAIPKLSQTRKSTKPPWWTEELEVEKGSVKRLRRRIHTANPRRRTFCLEEYLGAREAYKKNIEAALTNSWKDFCTRQKEEDVWTCAQRIITRCSNTSRIQASLLKDPFTDSILTADSSADLLATTFFPADDPGSDTPTQAITRENVRTAIQRLTQVRDPLSRTAPPFTHTELREVYARMSPKKAPGADGLTAAICHQSYRAHAELQLALFNKCLEIGHFPVAWKKARIRVIPKPGKTDYTAAKAYRPIGLLPILGKVLEKLVANRLTWSLERENRLSKRQYGFRPQCGTEDALYDIVNLIRRGIKAKKIVAVVSLDIEGAFDNAWWPAILQQLMEKNTDRDTLRLLDSYLSDRSITIEYLAHTVTRPTTKGCIQGSISGPILWNIQLDPLMVAANNLKAHVQAYADDLVVVAEADTASELEHITNEALDCIAEWGSTHKMRFAAHKTQAMILTKKLKYQNPKFSLQGIPLENTNRIKLLGLTIDAGLTFLPHLEAVTKKTASIFKMVARAARAQWGLNANILRTIYTGVVEPVVTYAASSWAEVAKKKYAKKKLDVITRMFAIKISKAHRTSSLIATAVLARVIPLDLRAAEYLRLYEVKRGRSLEELPGRELETRVHPAELPHPALRTEIVFRNVSSEQDLLKIENDWPRLYTDGSKIDGKVGAAVSCWNQAGEFTRFKLKLGNYCSVFQAELVAILRALTFINGKKTSTSANILSDSRSALESIADTATRNPITLLIQNAIAEAGRLDRQIGLYWVKAHVGIPGNERADELAKHAALHMKTAPAYDRFPLSFARRSIRESTLDSWQERFTKESNQDRGIGLFFSDVRRAYKILERVGTMNNLRAQLFTGHGGFREYLYRFKLFGTPSCVCDDASQETVKHLLSHCHRFLRERYDCEQRMGRPLESFAFLIGDDECRVHFLAFAEMVVERAAKCNGSTLP